AECVRRVLFVISSVPLPALSLAQAPAVPLIWLSDFARPPLSGLSQQTKVWTGVSSWALELPFAVPD
uniref:hypothetical protein n=1 Tax=Burkholderia sp. BCC0405 TaxID=2676298 RepID=UPI001ABADF46